MKVKMKFDKTLILGLLAQHGEKIALGAIVLCSAALVYAAMGGEKFNQTPDALVSKAERADNNITNTELKIDVKPVDILELIKKIGGDIDVKPYELSRAMNPPMYVPKMLRGEPVLLPPEQLRGASGLGRFDRSGMGMGQGAAGAVGPGGGGGLLGAGMGGAGALTTIGQRYVVVTGVIDNAKYYENYYNCFKAARVHTDADFVPVFRFFEVQRAEVTDEDDPVEESDWAPPYKGFGDEYFRYPARSGEVADQRFLTKTLVFPLPMRKDGLTWGEEVAHVPEVPLANYGNVGMGTPGATAPGEGEKKGAEEGKKKGDDPFAGAGGAGFGLGGPGFGGPRGPAGPAGPSLVGGGGFGGPGYGGMGMGGGLNRAKTTPYQLVRFFDYNAEPGKRYRYRFRVVVTNPNYNYPAKELAKELRERKADASQWTEMLRSPWSEASEMVAVPRDGRLLAASVTPGKGTREPRGEVMAINWDSESGDEVFDEFEIARGCLADFLDQPVPTPEQPTGMLGGPGMGPAGPMMGPTMGPMGPEPNAGRGGRRGRRGPKKKPAKPEVETVDYVTEMLVLDLRGGERLGRNGMTSPGEILLLDPDGGLEVRDDAEDDEARRQQKDPNRQQPGGMGGPGMFGPMGPAGPMGPQGPGGFE